MEIFSECRELVENYNTTLSTLFSITVIFLVFVLKTDIFGKKIFSGKFPRYGIITSFWMLSKMTFKPVSEVLQLGYRNYGRTHWLTTPTSFIFITGDPHLIKLICVQNFKFFSHRLNFTDIGDSILDNSILFLQNPKWKMCRSSLSPIFTSSKIKKMLPKIETCIQALNHNLFGFAQQGITVDIKSILDRFTLDVIAVSAFDFSLISKGELREEFLSHSFRIISKFSNIHLLAATFFPWIFTILGFKMLPQKSVHYFESLVKRTIEERTNSRQSQTQVDVIQLLLKEGKQAVNEETSMASKEFSLDEITSNCLTFLIAGFETTSTTLCSIIFCLAQNPSCQENLLKEVEKTTNTENSSADMPYLEAVISEAMRLFPPLPFVARTAVSECHVDGILFPKDTLVVIPIYAIHRDPDFFPDPEIFRPERFLTGDYNSDAFMPFGIGPRKCIGSLFSLIEVRSTLIQLVQNFKFISVQNDLKMKTNSPVLIPKELFVKIEKRLM